MNLIALFIGLIAIVVSYCWAMCLACQGDTLSLNYSDAIMLAKVSGGYVILWGIILVAGL